MTTPFVITTATEKVSLDQTRTGEATFTVTNQNSKVARGTFDIRTGENVDSSWFTIEEPQRTVRPGASVAVLVKINPGPAVPPGSYEFEARMTAADGAPEENFVLSRRVLIEVPAPPKAEKKKFPWWIIVAAALLALVIGVVTWLVWPASETAAPQPSASPSPTESPVPVTYAVVPKVEGQTIAAARKLITDAGLKVGTLNYRIGGPAGGIVNRQYVPATFWMPKGTPLDMEVSIPVNKPVVTSPGNNASIPKGQWPTVTWTTVDDVTWRWVIYAQVETCTRATAGGPETCNFGTYLAQPTMVTEKSFRFEEPKWDFTVKSTGTRHTGWVQVYVHHTDFTGQSFDAAVIKFFVEH